MIDAMRDEIAAIDADMVRLAARRVALGHRIAEEKRRQGLPTIDFAQEAQVQRRARDAAGQAGLDLVVAERLMATLIDASVQAQETRRIRASDVGAGRRVLLVGAAGRMGRWFHAFLADQGFAVTPLDTADGPVPAALPAADLILLAVPPRAAADWYARFAAEPPTGVVCDIASIKSPLAPALRQAQAAGVRVASIHPMFGPDARLLRDADIVACDVGDPETLAQVQELFAATTARPVTLELEAHDAWMADVLALAHATALAFAAALPAEPRPVRSPTLGALEVVAGSVVRESPEVYFEIQAGNPHAPAAVARLAAAVDRLRTLVQDGDAAGFARWMHEARTNLEAVA